MAPPLELPDELGEAFAVRAARAAGVTEKCLRNRALAAPFRGARTFEAVDSTDPGPEGERADAWRRIRAYAEIMPEHAFFVGPTAALIGGVPLPVGLHSHLHVGVEFPRTPPRRPGIRGTRIGVSGHVSRMHRLRVADPALTWATLGPHLREYDLVAATDYLLRIPRAPGGLVRLDRTDPYTTSVALAGILSEHRWRAAPNLRHALDRARTGASSRPETWSRLLIVDAGLPEPVLDHDVYDDAHVFIGAADLAYPHRKLAIEYEGEGHLDRVQFERDIERFARYEEADWSYVRLTSRHVFHLSHEVSRRVRRKLDRG
ncbi:hypothetical protein [Microbacterium sp. G2-8]|uniref:hypothetical protein n=1 Tax=Microbacterium sp. G2-8 TaxID=2842454 RepID=UPI001C89C0AE|nr:hypothetical protein [Microbacterium sp. G2-8]